MNEDLAAINPALERFSLGASLQEQAAAINELLAAKLLQKVATSSAFASGVSRLVETMRHPADGRERLAALVQLVWIAQSARKIAPGIRNAVTSLLSDRLEPASLLQDPDHRAYVAKACSWTSAPWVSDYVIDAMVTEDTGETVRAEFCEVLFSRVASIADIFQGLRPSVSRLALDTETPADSMAVRITRILAAVRTGLVVSLLPSGADPGLKLSELVRTAFASTGWPRKEERQVALAREIVLCTYDLVRTRFSLATDADTYAALKAAKTPFGKSSWPKELRADLDRLAGSILEALLLLGKQGLMPQQLADHLGIVVNNQTRADFLLRTLADAHPELDESVRAWLRRTRIPQGGGLRDTLAASQDLRLDPSLGHAIVESAKVAECVAAVRSRVVPVLQLYDPTALPILELGLVRTESLQSVLADIASRRRLGLYGEVGQEIDFVPKYFDAVGEPAGVRVRVLKAAVVRLGEDSQPGEVVVKGLVQSS